MRILELKNNCASNGIAAIMIIFAAGCQLPDRRYEPPTDHAELSDVQFVHYLAAVPTVTLDEGVRAVGVLIDEEGGAAQFNSRVAMVGTLAYMLAAVCEMPPSANAAVSNATGVGKRRYALRACISAEMLPYSAQGQAVRGGELVSALSRCSLPPLPR